MAADFFADDRAHLDQRPFASEDQTGRKGEPAADKFDRDDPRVARLAVAAKDFFDVGDPAALRGGGEFFDHPSRRAHGSRNKGREGQPPEKRRPGMECAG